MPLPAPPEAAPPPAALAVQTITVVAAAPLPAAGLRDAPVLVLPVTSQAIDRAHGGSVADLLDEASASVTLSDAQGNPFQRELAFRGFSASPVLGTPQGVSVFIDGVRINEPFGDIVQWDLVPTAALDHAELMPGSHPLFGLNTLGGALVMRTRSGRDDPGSLAEAWAGAHGQRGVQWRHGSFDGPWDGLLMLQSTRDEGWRAHGGSRVAQGFARWGWRAGRDDAQASLTLADSRLEGAQTLPRSFLDDPAQAYTWPDTQHNRLAMGALRWTRQLDDGSHVSAQAHLRFTRGATLSSNVEVDAQPTDAVQATNDETRLRQSSTGFALQWSSPAAAGRRQRWLLGIDLQAGRARYVQRSQDARFDAQRGTVALGAFQPGSDAGTRTHSTGVYAMDTIALGAAWSLSLSARHEATRIAIDDRSGQAPALDGRHRFARFNPGLGVLWQPTSAWSAFASASEGLRAPTAMELTCADPQAPCRLPTGFVSDPPLKAVVARTLETGLRGRSAWGGDGELQWSGSLWRTDVRDDIQFVASGSALAGYFRNVGATRRQGFEIGLQARRGPITTTLRIARVDATFRSAFDVHSPFHPQADADGVIHVAPGARLPGVVRDSLRWRVEATLAQDTRWGLAWHLQGSSVLRGDESNQALAQRVPGRGLLHLDAEGPLAGAVRWWLQVHNLAGRRSVDAGLLGRNAFTGPGRSFSGARGRNEPFYAPGEPRSISAGVKFSWD
jgi:outer membrane receptor protein involved in Fe transport